MLVRMHYKENMLDVVWFEAEAVLTIQMEVGKGTEVFLKSGMTLFLHETPDEVGAAVNQMLEAKNAR